MQSRSKSKALDYCLSFPKGPGVTLHVEKCGSFHLSLSDSFCCLGGNEALIEWLRLYSEGIHSPWPITFRGTPFQNRVLQVMQQIPFGKTESYQELAHLCGQPKAARAVGNVCNFNHFPLIIPCHRVIRSNGEIGGFAYDLEIKRRLLEFEAG